MGNPTKKWKTKFLVKNFPAKNDVFWFWPKIQKLRPFYIIKKSENSESGVRFTIPYQMEPYGQQNGTFWPKMAFFATGGSSKPPFLTDFQWRGTATGIAWVLSFWPFLVIFGQFSCFCYFSSEPLTNTTLLCWKFLNLHSLKSDSQYLTWWSCKDSKNCIFWHF